MWKYLSKCSAIGQKVKLLADIRSLLGKNLSAMLVRTELSLSKFCQKDRKRTLHKNVLVNALLKLSHSSLFFSRLKRRKHLAQAQNTGSRLIHLHNALCSSIRISNIFENNRIKTAK